MVIEPIQKAAAPLHAAKARQMFGHLKCLRGVRGLSVRTTRCELAQALGVSQPAISKTLKADPACLRYLPGSTGGREFIARFSTGDITREQILRRYNVVDTASWLRSIHPSSRPTGTP